VTVEEGEAGGAPAGTLFASEHFTRGPEDVPDIMTRGEGIGAGVPLAALCATERVAVFEHGEQGGTYSGNPLMTAVGCAVMTEMLKPGFLPHVVAVGNHLSQRLIELVSEF